ncbi:MAG: mechanosensitive ion channel [Anaerolineales bacterium]|nr:mechanosensitive ion channel [Anaerolineales bacterium]
MDAITDFFNGPIGQLIVNLVIALIILIVGWIVARIVARVVRGILNRVKLDNRLAEQLSDPDERREIKVEDFIARLTFWLIMLFVLVAFFEQLGLFRVAEPFAVFLQALTVDYLPRLGGALLLLFVAWIIATILRFLVRKGLALTKLDDRMSEYGALEEGEKVTFSQSLSDGIFWLTLLLFLPPVLAALGLQSISDQFESVLDTIFEWIPGILAAAAILLLGIFLARVIRQIVTGLLKSIGTDRFGERIGLREGRVLSELIGSLVYSFLLLVVIAMALNQLNIAAISDPMTSFIGQIISAIPGLIGAALLLVVAYAVARVVGGLVGDLLSTVGFDSVPERLGLSWSAENSPSEWVGRLTVVIIMLFAATAAFELLGSAFLVEAMDTFLALLWNVFLGAVVFAFGLYFANLAYNIIYRTGMNQANFIGRAAQVAIILFAGAIALQQIGVGEEIVNIAFGVVMLAIGLAVALSFGLGTKDIAHRETENVIKSLRAPDKGDIGD